MKKVYLLLYVFILGITVQAQVTKTWVSNVVPASPNNWNDATSWLPNGVPAANDIVVFSNTKNDTVTLQSNVACGSISVQGTNNIVLRSSGGVFTVSLGATTPALNINASRSLTLIGTAASQGTVLSIPTGGTATINGSLNLAPFNNAIASQQSQLLSVDAGSVVVNSGGTVLLGPSNSVSPFGATSVANDIVVFKSGSKFTAYTNTSPWGTVAAPSEIVSFQQGSIYSLFGGTGFPNFGGRTLGTLILSGGNNGGISNATANTTTILDSLVISSTAGSNVTFSRGSGGSAVPTFSFNNIRISATGANNTPVVFSNNGVDNATYTISGGIIVNTAAAATGNALLTLGNTTVNTSNTTTSITLTGSGKAITTEDQGAGSGAPSILFATNGTGNTGVKNTNLIIDSTANIALNANLDLTTTNITSNLTVRVRGVLSVGAGYTLTTNDKLTLQSSAFGTGSIGNSAGTISGNATVQRYIPANAAWRTLGLPFNNVTTYVGGTASTNQVSLSRFASKNPTWAYYYDETKDNGKYGTTSGAVNAGWTAITSGTTGLATQNGLLLYGSKNSAAYTLSGFGTINSGTQTIPLSKTVNGWNLIANPFASNISFTSIVNNGSNSGAVSSNTVYRVRPLGGGAYTFTSYVAGSNTGTNGGSDVIENGASFFVKAVNAGSSLTIKESDKTNNAVSASTGGVTLLGAKDNYNTIAISLNGANKQSDEVVFVWGRFNKATEGFDEGIDAYDLGASGTHDLAIVDNTGTRYSIFNGADLQKNTKTRTYTLATKNLQVGTYSFAVTMPTALDKNNEAYIRDNYLGTTVLVKEGLLHSFQVTADAASKAEGRFQLEIRKK